MKSATLKQFEKNLENWFENLTEEQKKSAFEVIKFKTVSFLETKTSAHQLEIAKLADFSAENGL